jgi:hypothetical protein
MTRTPLLQASLLAALAATGCTSRYEVFTAWNVNGAPAANACQQLRDPSVQIRVQNREVEGGEVTEETVTAPCADGQARIETAALARLFIDLLDGEEIFGVAGPLAVAPGGGGPYLGEEPAKPVVANINLERGRLHARLTVVGRSCGEAEADSFTVSLKRQTGPLGKETVVSDATVSCSDGAALFEHAPVEIGSRYEVVAETTVGGVRYSTDDGAAGAGALVERALTDLVVDLDIVGRP